jgi:hypothetical protein
MKYNDRHTRNIVSKYQDKDHSFYDHEREYRQDIKRNLKLFQSLLKGKYLYWYKCMNHNMRKEVYAKYVIELKTVWATNLDYLVFSECIKNIDIDILEKVYQENNPNMDSYRDSQIDKIIGILE